MFQEADMIYVGGGDTVFMMKKWKENHLNTYLLEAYEKGKVMCGMSAGAICWFSKGHSDSEAFAGGENWSYIWADGLGIYDIAFCPHYNEGRESFDEMVKETGLTRLALENDTALVILNGRCHIRKADEERQVYAIRYNGDRMIKSSLVPENEFVFQTGNVSG